MGVFIAGIERDGAPGQSIGCFYGRARVGGKSKQRNVMINQRKHHICLGAFGIQRQGAFKKGLAWA